jgi:hypothetical protein
MMKQAMIRLERELPEDVKRWLYDAPIGEGNTVRMVPLTAYLELMEKFKTVNFEYTRLSNTWMGFAAQKRPTNLEVGIMELRGENSVRIADLILKRMEETERKPGWRKWKFRLAMWLWSKLTGQVWVYGMKRFQ